MKLLNKKSYAHAKHLNLTLRLSPLGYGQKNNNLEIATV